MSPNLKVASHTLGCKLNYAETASLDRQFKAKGFDIVEFDTVADVYLINTCTVTQNAEKECRQIVRRVLRQNPEAFVILTGCYAQLRPGELSNIDGVDLILGSKEKFDLFKYAGDFIKTGHSCTFVSSTDELTDDFGPASSAEDLGRTRAYFKVQDGCDYKCSYCTIPLARGKSRSYAPEKADADFGELIANGYKEIVLTGVNVGDYGLAYDTNLHQLIQKFTKTYGEYRIRISSIEPNLLTDEILEHTKTSESMCNHFHVPLQSGSEKILKLMQRRYNKVDYESLIKRIKAILPDAGIGVDVIVGFPGETETEFLETFEFLKNLPISYLHVFTYSERPNTKAIEMAGSVDVFERKRRTNMLRVLSLKKKEEFYNSQFGKKERVLFEANNKEGFIYGFTSNYVRVRTEFNENLVNKFVDIVIQENKGDYCSIVL